MERGIPIISNGILHNESNKTREIPDLIVGPDFINKLVELPVLTEDEIKVGCNSVRIGIIELLILNL